MWIVSFITLYISIVWLSFLYLNEFETKSKIKKYLSVTIAVPAYNEEKGIEKTINSILALDYPKDKLKIIVINDGSKDNTRKIVESMIKKNKGKNIQLINKKMLEKQPH